MRSSVQTLAGMQQGEAELADPVITVRLLEATSFRSGIVPLSYRPA